MFLIWKGELHGPCITKVVFVICCGKVRMSFSIADISAIQQQHQSQLNSSLQSSSPQNVTTISNNSINDHNFTSIENGTSFEYQQILSNAKVNYTHL